MEVWKPLQWEWVAQRRCLPLATCSTLNNHDWLHDLKASVNEWAWEIMDLHKLWLDWIKVDMVSAEANITRIWQWKSYNEFDWVNKGQLSTPRVPSVNTWYVGWGETLVRDQSATVFFTHFLNSSDTLPVTDLCQLTNQWGQWLHMCSLLLHQYTSQEWAIVGWRRTLCPKTVRIGHITLGIKCFWWRGDEYDTSCVK